jgi:hypothetical protein
MAGAYLFFKDATQIHFWTHDIHPRFTSVRIVLAEDKF